MSDRATELGLVDFDLASATSVGCAKRELNADIAVRSFKAGRGLALHRPVDIYLQVASACNLDCYMCAEHNRPEEWRHGRGLKSLSPELFAKIEREVFPYAKRLTIGVGGEPTISKHFPDYLQRAKDAGLDVHVMTNGSMINTDKKAELLVRCTKSIEVSVDGASKETYERIRIGGKWDRLVSNLQRIKRVREGMPQEDRSHLTLCFVLMKSNIEEFPAFVGFAKAVGADRISGWHVIPMTPEGHGETLQDHRALSNAFCEAACKRGQELGIEVDVPKPFVLKSGEGEPEIQPVDFEGLAPAHVIHSLIEPTIEGDPDGVPEDGEDFAFADEEEDAEAPESPFALSKDAPPIGADPVQKSADEATDPDAPENSARLIPQEGGMIREASRHSASKAGRIHCSSPSTSVFLFFDGRVLPCCHPHAHNSLDMGNLHDASFAEIWNNDLYQNLREGLFKGDAPLLCQSCSIIHSPPPREERFEDLVGPGKDLRSYYENHKPKGEAESEKAFVLEALSKPWHTLYKSIESLAEDRKGLREGLEELKAEFASEVESYRSEREELAKRISDFEVHTKGLQDKLDDSLYRGDSPKIFKLAKMAKRISSGAKGEE